LAIFNAVMIDDYDQSFRNSKSFQERKNYAAKLREKYPDRFPIIIESHRDLKLDKKKYLVPKNLSVGQFFHLIRNRLKLSSEQGLFIFTEDGSIPPVSESLEAIYKSARNDDNFLYFKLSPETVFG
jgi:GABA(A) receptor-associated protein